MRNMGTYNLNSKVYRLHSHIIYCVLMKFQVVRGSMNIVIARLVATEFKIIDHTQRFFLFTCKTNQGYILVNH